MRVTIGRTSLLAVAVLATGCVAAAPNVDMRAETAALDNVRTSYESAFNKKDVAAVAALYTADAWVLPEQAATITTQPGVQSWVENGLKAGVSNLKLTSDHKEIASAGDLAVDVGTFSETVPSPTGPMQMTGRYMVLLKKVDGQWKLVADMNNAALPPAIPAANSASESQHK